MFRDFECEKSDLIVFSHLRWDFVYQRPQHLISRFADHRRVYFFEEPIHTETNFPYLNLRTTDEGVTVAIPHIPAGLSYKENDFFLKKFVDDLLLEEEINDFSCWYYTPMALTFSRHIKPKVVLYDMMDELSLFKNAPEALIDLENELLGRADVVFTGGHSLFEAKQSRHHNIYPVPSSIDYSHFSKGRSLCKEPEDQAHIPRPRVGFYGVIDERFDTKLLEEISTLRPDLQFVVIGPVVKIDPESLPKAKNIHYLGKKSYQELPTYLAGWDCAMMPFALNDSTRFISPTKTPEFLAAGKPVVSTRIYDVVRPYEERKLVRIADSAHEFCEGIDAAMIEKEKNESWLSRVDEFLAGTSWDATWKRIADLEKSVMKKEPYVPVRRLVRPSKVMDLNAMRPS